MERRKMLASTIQFSHNTPTPQQPHTNQCAIIHSAGQQDNHNHTNTVWLTVCCPRHPTACQHTKKQCLRKQSRPRSATQCICHCGCASTRISKYFSVAVTHSATSTTTRPTTVGTKQKLLRKEVIQPHLPVRLPCYDFVPIADPTFDHSLTRLGHGLRVLPTFMT